MLRVLLGVRFKVSATGRRLISLRFISVPPSVSIYEAGTGKECFRYFRARYRKVQTGTDSQKQESPHGAGFLGVSQTVWDRSGQLFGGAGGI